MDDVFKALADPGRRRLLDSLNTRNGQNLRDLCAELDMARQSVSKHLAVLEEANLVSTVWHGREKLHYLNAEPINAIAERWMSRYDRARARALTDLKTALEQAPMDNTTLDDATVDNGAADNGAADNASPTETRFVYTTYIKTTPQKLWQALTDPAFTKRYWGVAFETDWAEGSTMTWHEAGVRIADPEQVVLEAEPGRRLSYTWHTYLPEWAQAHGIDDTTFARLAAERRSKVTFEIEPLEHMVKLTVIHDDFEPGSATLEGVSTGWPAIVANLKTLLETGESLPI